MTFILSAPFGLSVIDIGPNGLHSGLLERIFSTAAGYPYVTVNAYNPWALASQDGNGLAAAGTWICDTIIANPVQGGASCPTGFMVLGAIPAVALGAALLAFAFVLVCGVVALRPDRLRLLVGLTVLAVAFFVLPTRVHERYLYPFFALGAVLAAVSGRWRIAYVALSVVNFLNMYVVLTTLYPDNPQISDWLGIGPDIRSLTTVTIIALVHLAGFIWISTQLQRRAEGRLLAEIELGRAADP